MSVHVKLELNHVEAVDQRFVKNAKADGLCLSSSVRASAILHTQARRANARVSFVIYSRRAIHLGVKRPRSLFSLSLTSTVPNLHIVALLPQGPAIAPSLSVRIYGFVPARPRDGLYFFRP
jgi:hypothetical protein